MTAETGQMRARRRQRRSLFDGIADQYEASRPGYPPQIVGAAIEAAGLGPGSPVLEVGCGTGQLTGDLAARGLAVTAIDIGAATVAAARRRLAAWPVALEAVAFEDFVALDDPFEMIISATAFHWVDPEVKFVKAARLLRPGGWLALLSTGERYDEPLRTALRDMWLARSDDAAAWAGGHRQPETDLAGAAGLFGPPVERAHSQRVVLPARAVLGVETTRATYLSWPEDVRARFAEELRGHLAGDAEVHLTQHTSLAMAQVLAGAAGQPGGRAR